MQSQVATSGNEAANMPAPAAKSGSTVFNVTDFGAVADGVTDDTAAIQTTMERCAGKAAPLNGCVLYFPAGVYMTTGLSLKSFMHIKGDGWGTSVIQLMPHTAADVLTVPIDAFNFSIHGLTIDGNRSKGGTGNCFSTAATPTSPAKFNVANKETASMNPQKWGHIEEVIFSNCSADGIHINAFNYMLYFDNFYAFNNGMYGLYTEGTNSGFSNFQIERNGTAGIHAAGSSNRFTSGEVIWNGASGNAEAGVYVSGNRNLITAVETEDNYTNGFFDRGNNNEFIGCVSDANGYRRRNPDASSRIASGFVMEGTGGVYVGDKVTSYRDRLPDGNFATEWPYKMTNVNQSRVDISYDRTNQPPQAATNPSDDNSPAAPVQAAPSAPGHAACIKSAGPPVTLGSCSSEIGSSGDCTCN